MIIDQKPYYLFGRNKEACDFTLEHTSCSRVHAALVFHKHLNRTFLIDLKSSKYIKVSYFNRTPQLTEFQLTLCFCSIILTAHS